MLASVDNCLMEKEMPTKEYYWSHREKCIADAAKWKQDNPERARENSTASARRVRATPEGKARQHATDKRWRDSHPEEVKRRRDEWYAKHGAAYHREWAAKKRVSDPVLFIWRNARNRAKELGREFEIRRDHIVIPEFCPVLGIKIQKGNGPFQPNSPSLDRIDSSRGYIPGNVEVISWRANMLKRDGTLDEFERIVAYMRAHGAS